MLVNDIFERVIIRSGQFLMNKANIEINVDAFKILVEDALAIYSPFRPYVRTLTKQIISPRSFTLTKENTIDGVPDFISEATPILSSGLGIAMFHELRKEQNINSEIVEPIEAPWDWNDDTKTLTVSSSATWSIKAAYYHKVTDIPFDPELSYEVKTITIQDHLFHDLLRGMFMQGIGRSRRAFTMDALPISMDASEIVTDGETLEEKTLEKLEDQMDFSLAYT